MHYKLAAYLLLLFFVSCQDQAETDRPERPKTKPQPITVPAGFTVDSIYSPSAHGQGSWVALAEAPNNTFYASDQFGGLYTFKMPAVGSHMDSTQVDSIELNIGHAHGLLWAFNSLYVAVNRSWERDDVQHGSGVYRLTDTDDDGALDHIDMLLELDGAGEHGPHSFVVGPTGDRIYFIAGNHTILPKEVSDNSRLPDTWGEDNLLPPYLDARGHANDITAPGGWIASFKPDGSDWELAASGFRNAFDIGFNADGELFAFDADMEWDIGMPWYRPIRICHAVSGAEFGWRTGTGKWPAYYPDNLPSVVDLGQGSPTAVVMAKDLKFGPSYQDGLFAIDWSFGTMYYVDLSPSGSTYTGSRSEFLSGAPLPLTDAIAASDGSMYFAIGGRRLKSALYRVRYTGPAATESESEDAESAQLRELRASLEQLHVNPSSNAVAVAWKNLDHEDRFIRYAARIALEHQPTSRWQARVLNTNNTQKLLEGALGLARSENTAVQKRLIQKLLTLGPEDLTDEQKIAQLRAMELSMIRHGNPDETERTAIGQALSSYPTGQNLGVDRLVASILIHLRIPEGTGIASTLLEKHTKEGTTTAGLLSSEVTARSAQYGPAIENVMKYTPPSEAIHYAVALSHAQAGWTDQLREDYFQWYFDVMGTKGGLSFKAFMENARQKALSNVPESDRQRFDELSGVFKPGADLANLPQPSGDGGVYNQSEANKILREYIDEDYLGDFAQAKRTYQAALCGACHRMHGEGGIIGPDLSQINTRFNRGEILTAIIAPHDEISDQYAFTLFELKDGSKKAGRIASENEEVVTIMPNPYTSALKVDIQKADIVSQGLSPISPMPPGLLNRLSEKEIVELMTYLMSGGDEDHKFFNPEASD